VIGDWEDGGVGIGTWIGDLELGTVIVICGLDLDCRFGIRDLGCAKYSYKLRRTSKMLL